MNKKRRSIGKIIRKQRKSIPLSLVQLSQMSGVSASHLARIENGERVASPKSLQRIAKPLGFDLNELLIRAGYISPEPPHSSEEQRNKLRAELSGLLERVEYDNKRIKEIVDRLLISTG
jgi:transcriptional regulator with XRE-family HTH domain